MSSNESKKLGLAEVVLFGVCTVLVVDTVAASAIAGPGGMVWWLILLFAFFLPYGLITAELTTTYPAEGGIYDWVKRAFGRRWGARTAWLYWINYAMWIPAVFYLFAVVIGQIFNITFSPWTTALISIAMSWVCSWISTKPVADAAWISTTGAIFKVLIMLILGVGGILMAMTGEMATTFELSSLKPNLTVGLSILPVILFNLMGVEVIAGASDSMKDPKNDIPKATIYSGLLIALMYLIAAFGVQAALPVDQISESAGLYDSLAILFGTEGAAGMMIKVVAVLFMFTLVANIVNWSVGVNYVAIYAARNGDMPSIFGTETEDGGPKGAPICNGIVATVVMIAYALVASIGGYEDLFWNVFSLGAVTLLLSYLVMFPAFLKLRRIDAGLERPYKLPGGEITVKIASYVPMGLLALGVITFFWVPGEPLDTTYLWQVGSGVGIAILIGEIFIQRHVSKEKDIRVRAVVN